VVCDAILKLQHHPASIWLGKTSRVKVTLRDQSAGHRHAIILTCARSSSVTPSPISPKDFLRNGCPSERRQPSDGVIGPVASVWRQHLVRAMLLTSDSVVQSTNTDTMTSTISSHHNPPPPPASRRHVPISTTNDCLESCTAILARWVDNLLRMLFRSHLSLLSFPCLNTLHHLLRERRRRTARAEKCRPHPWDQW
jgi:hypothetical protein